MNDSGALAAVAATAGATTTSPSKATATNSLTPTLVGAAGGLQFNLMWDTSVARAPTSFKSAIVAAAQAYATLYSNHEVINIHVGYGEVNGSSMASGALGESESYGYMANYQTVDAKLQQDASSSTYQQSADASLKATNPTGAGQFFVNSAEAKTLGLTSGSSTAVDGYIGISSAYPMDYATNVSGNHMASNQYDAIGVAEHEISEVMGRVGSEGSIMGSGIYTPLDLFRYSANNVRDLKPSAGYLSVDGGKTNLGAYNNPQKGGDAADWTPSLVGDSYGDGYAGRTAALSATDIIENAILGYRLTSAGLNATRTAGLA